MSKTIAKIWLGVVAIVIGVSVLLIGFVSVIILLGMFISFLAKILVISI